MNALRLALAAALLAGCSTPESRIRDHKTAFDASTPAVQEKIKAGQADMGFTREQVAMALGWPDRIMTRRTATGESEVWVYGVSRANVGFGLGFGTFGPGGAIGVGTSVAPGPGDGARLRVIFTDGAVSSLETRAAR